jgi:hypothetical protein
MEETKNDIIKIPEGLSVADQISWVYGKSIIHVIEYNPGLNKLIKKIREKKQAREGKV